MDNIVKVKFIRDDLKEFLIDNEYWKIPSKEGLQNFGYFENDITLIANAVTDGSMIAAHRMGQIDRTICFYNQKPRVNNQVDRAELLTFFTANHKYKVYVTYLGVTRWFEGMIYKCEIPTQNINWRLDVTLTFICPDPYLKSNDNFGKDIANIKPMCAFPYLSSIEKGFTTGAYEFSRNVTLNNNGDSSAPFVAEFKALGTVTNPKLLLDGYFVRVLDVMQENDIITMDFAAMPPTIKKNGVNYIGHCDRKSQFDKMRLEIGDNTISFDADNGSNYLSVSIYFNKLYCGI